MKFDLKLFAIAIFLLAIPVLMALPQSFLVSDVVLSNNLSSKQGQGQQTPDEERRMPLFGKITAIHNASLEISNANGDTVTVKITSQTEFRKDRQAAKRSDFKVGDVIAVRGQENPDHTWTAQTIGSRSANGEGRGPNMQAGTLGKDYVAGEVKGVDAPKISVLRSDNVTQTIELNEDTSLRKGRDALGWAAKPCAWRSFAKTCGAAELKSLAPALLFLLVFASAGFLHAQDPPPTPQDHSTPAESVASMPAPVATSFQINGIVKAGKTPLPGVTVTATNSLTGKKFTVATGVNGTYTFTGLPRGRYVVRVEFMSFAPQTQEIVLKPETPTGKFDAEMILA